MPVREGPRRRAPRVTAAIPGLLRGRSTRSVTAVDISLTGCLVRAAHNLDAGSIHELELELPGERLSTPARVSETSLDGTAQGDTPRYLVGLEFLGLGARQEALLRGFLETEMARRDGVSGS
jgi:c-di-GMP-binding flagellar brake protein YcgR